MLSIEKKIYADQDVAAGAANLEASRLNINTIVEIEKQSRTNHLKRRLCTSHLGCFALLKLLDEELAVEPQQMLINHRYPLFPLVP